MTSSLLKKIKVTLILLTAFSIAHLPPLLEAKAASDFSEDTKEINGPENITHFEIALPSWEAEEIGFKDSYTKSLYEKKAVEAKADNFINTLKNVRMLTVFGSASYFIIKYANGGDLPFNINSNLQTSVNWFVIGNTASFLGGLAAWSSPWFGWLSLGAIPAGMTYSNTRSFGALTRSGAGVAALYAIPPALWYASSYGLSITRSLYLKTTELEYTPFEQAKANIENHAHEACLSQGYDYVSASSLENNPIVAINLSQSDFDQGKVFYEGKPVSFDLFNKLSTQMRSGAETTHYIFAHPLECHYTIYSKIGRTFSR